MLITMAHGSGGIETEALVKEVFLKYFRSGSLNRMEDAAVIELNGKAAFTTDSYVVTPLFFPGGDIGKLAVCGTVNDLSMMGAQPKYLTAGFIIEEGMDTDTLAGICESMAKMAIEAGIEIVAGDTKVIEGKGGLYINTAGIGFIPQERQLSAVNCGIGDVILCSGNLGDHHACILGARMGIKSGIHSDVAPLNKLTEALLKNHIKIKAMRDITRGGLATVLNELCASSKKGAVIYEKQLPVAKETASFCEILGLDPLYMGNEGKFIAVIAEEDAKKAADILKTLQYGENACIIGSFYEGRGVSMVTRLGGKRRIGPLYGEGLPRIC